MLRMVFGKAKISLKFIPEFTGDLPKRSIIMFDAMARPGEPGA
jgi:hypothetical protein